MIFDNYKKMINYLFYYENENYLIYQRTCFSNIFIIYKHKNIKQYIDPDFFVKILKTSLSDTDILFLFPWKMDLAIDKYENVYLEKYKNCYG